MRKINYPFKTDSEKEIFLNEYFDKISPEIPNQSEIIKKIKDIDPTWDLKKILTADFGELVEFFKKDNTVSLNQYFKTRADEKGYLYSDLQRTIADFFISQKINLRTCFYCNIEYINSFNDEFSSVEELINFAQHKQIKQIIGKTKASKITISRKAKSLTKNDVLKLISDEDYNLLRNELSLFNEHFTLDHVMSKKVNTFISLSIFNLVPCCYSCNSKFKLEKDFEINKNLPKIIPTCNEYIFNDLIQFQLKFKVNDKDKLILKTDLSNLSNNKNVDEFIAMFKLKNRYEFHKPKAEDLINKRKIYSDSQIREIAKLLGRDEQSIKEDIFGKECFESNNEPFEKYKQDIARQIGLLKTPRTTS